MQELNLAPQHLGLYQKMESVLQSVAPKFVWQYSKIIFPVLKSTNSMASLLSNMITYFDIQSKKGIQTTKILLQLLKKAKQTNDQSLFRKMKQLFQTDFTSTFVQLMSMKKQQRINQGGEYLNTPRLFHHNLNIYNNGVWGSKNGDFLKNRQYLEANLSNLTMNRPKVQLQLQLKNKVYTKIKDPFTQSSSAFQYTQQKANQNATPISILDRIELQNQIVQNYLQASKKMCVCGKIIDHGQSKQQSAVFNCQRCGSLFHMNCLKLQKTGFTCSLCQIQTINPVHKILKPLFMGVLHKNKRNHSISIPVDQKLFNNTKIKLQIRSVRLKQKIQKQILFPDSASIICNHQLIKQFLPLHRQSSLKYRKDQAVTLQNFKGPRINIIVSQRFPTKQKKDERIELQDHLIGVFAVQQLTINQLIQSVQKNCTMNFNQSKNILKNTFQLNNQSTAEQQLTCDIVKIPLTCILSTQAIRIPVRGRYCTHFQCFDLQNYLLMTVSSSYPKWICPLCKKSTGQLVQDFIIKEILKLQIKNATQVMFHKSGQFVVKNKQQSLDLAVKNIFSFEQAEIEKIKLYQEKRKIIEKQCDQTIQEIILKGFPFNKQQQTLTNSHDTINKAISISESFSDKNIYKKADQKKGLKRAYAQKFDFQDEKTKKKIKFVIPQDVSVIDLD